MLRGCIFFFPLPQTDKGFDKTMFERQMSVMRGQVSVCFPNYSFYFYPFCMLPVWGSPIQPPLLFVLLRRQRLFEKPPFSPSTHVCLFFPLGFDKNIILRWTNAYILNQNKREHIELKIIQ